MGFKIKQWKKQWNTKLELEKKRLQAKGVKNVFYVCQLVRYMKHTHTHTSSEFC